jgi:hypothetical protein
MLEKDMKELVARFPSDFFPQEELVLLDRQGLLPDAGCDELLFRNKQGISILMALKARPAMSLDADELAKRADALSSSGTKDVVLRLVATNIQPSVRDLLGSLGIEYAEIPVAEYYRIAEKHDFQVTHQKAEEVEPRRPPTGEMVSRHNSASTGHTQSVITDEFLRRVSALEKGFQAAHTFMTELAQDKIADFRLGTDLNAHLYYSKDKNAENEFCAYIEIRTNEKVINFTSRANGRPWAETRNKKSGLIFGPPLRGLVTELGGRRDGWAIPHDLGISLNNKTPSVFFERLLDKIREVHK